MSLCGGGGGGGGVGVGGGDSCGGGGGGSSSSSDFIVRKQSLSRLVSMSGGYLIHNMNVVLGGK